MKRKQLLLLFFCSLVPWIVGNGLTPLLPVYALSLGASQAAAGYYFAFVFAALAGGTFFAGWFADKLQRRKLLLILSGAAVVPMLWVMGEVGNIWQLTAATATLWFLLGMQGPLIATLAGLFAAAQERGRVFGLLALTGQLGGVVGGLTVGPMVDRWGYPTMFAVLALLFLAPPVIAVFVEDRRVERVAQPATPQQTEKPNFGKAFLVLLLAHFAVVLVHGTGTIGRSLAMNGLGFPAAAITSSIMIAGLVGLPFPYVLGWLSDRLGRKRLMMICYLLYALAMVVFAVSKSLWHFWIATILMGIGYDSGTVGTAFVADLVPPKALGRGVSFFHGTFWVGMVVGLAGSGYAFQNLGIPAVMFASAALPLIGMVLLSSIREARPPLAPAAVMRADQEHDRAGWRNGGRNECGTPGPQA